MEELVLSVGGTSALGLDLLFADFYFLAEF
jgi:hypothetical protein